MDLAIIIVNWNGGDVLQRCLASIRDHSRGQAVQVIVVDNNSADGSRENAQRLFPEYQVINSGANIGFGRANNLARTFVRAPFVLFLNPDTQLLDGVLQTMAKFMRGHAEVGALGCSMLDDDGSPGELPLQWAPSPWTQLLHLLLVTGNMSSTLRRLLPYADPRNSGYVTKLYGGCIMARKEALDAIGWFDERYFMYAEDIDLCHSILASGWKLYYLAEARITHAGGAASSKTRADFPILMRCESISKLMRKYHGLAGAWIYRLIVMAACPLRLLGLALLKPWSALFPEIRDKDFPRSVFKYKTMLLWSVKLRKPMIPKGIA